MRKINVRFLDVLGSRGGYNYIISGMMYSTSCWNYRLSQNRRYDKERENNREKVAKWYRIKQFYPNTLKRSGRPCPMIYLVPRLINYLLWFFFVKRKYRSSYSWINSFVIHLIMNFLFFSQILLIFQEQMYIFMPEHTIFKSIVIYILKCTLVTDQLYK